MDDSERTTTTTALCVGGPLSGQIVTAEGDSFGACHPQPGPDADGLQIRVSYPLVVYVRHASPRFGTLWALRGMTPLEVETEYLRLRSLLA